MRWWLRMMLGVLCVGAVWGPQASTASATIPDKETRVVGATTAQPGCSQSGNVVTCTYATQSEFVVPTGVSSVMATAVGAQGGTDIASGTAGGLGAVASGRLAVTPGQILYVEVGALGGDGGRDNTGARYGGFGGGESDVRTCPAVGPCPTGSTLSSRLLVAGGGGGTGQRGTVGGNAGTTGAAGTGANGGSYHHGAVRHTVAPGGPRRRSVLAERGVMAVPRAATVPSGPAEPAAARTITRELPEVGVAQDGSAVVVAAAVSTRTTLALAGAAVRATPLLRCRARPSRRRARARRRR